MRIKWLVTVMLVLLVAVPTAVPERSSASWVCEKVRVAEYFNGSVRYMTVKRCHEIPDPPPPAGTTAEPSATVSTPACAEKDKILRTALRNKQHLPNMVCGAAGGGGGGGAGAAPDWGAIALMAFRDTAIPTTRTIIQPPGGKTLVNFETLFRTEAAAFTRTMNLLGERIQLRIRPISYTWVTGDGDQFTTTKPGVKYEERLPMTAYNVHNYAKRAEALHPRVDITWRATYRVGNGAWLPVAGSLTKSGPETTLQVVEGRPTLIEAR